MLTTPVIETNETRPYEPPAIVWERELAETEPWLWWAVLVGWSYTTALAWAAYCTYKGGDPYISFGWKGFKVSCYR